MISLAENFYLAEDLRSWVEDSKEYRRIRKNQLEDLLNKTVAIYIIVDDECYTDVHRMCIDLVFNDGSHATVRVHRLVDLNKNYIVRELCQYSGEISVICATYTYTHEPEYVYKVLMSAI